MSDEPITALYSPSRRQVACVIIQSLYDGDKRACALWDDWCTDIVGDFRMITASEEQWRDIGRRPRQDRPGPESFGTNS